MAPDRSPGHGKLDSCVICLEPVSERAIVVPCNHYSFDFLCLLGWLEHAPSCPLCKRTVTKIEYHWRSPSHCDTYIVAAAESEAAAATGHPRRPWPARPAARRQLAAHRLCDLAAPDVALARRRFVYGRALYSLHVGSNRLSQYREVTPAMLASDGALQSRARAWLRRELRVFPFLAPDHPHAADLAGPASARAVRNAEFLLEYIIAILKAVDLYGAAGQAEELLQEYLGRENTLLFLHELKAFLRSPFARPEDWDRKVQYRVKLPLRFPE